MIRSAVIVEGNELDLLQEIEADFTFSIQDIREPDSRRTDFSKTIELPGTPRNNALFAHLFNVNIENQYDPEQPNIGYNFNPNKVAKAIVTVDNIEVFRGVLRVLKVRVERDKITYETNVIGRLADILFALGDKKLSDIDFSSMDHTLSFGHIQTVWNDPASYGYAYPLIDYGMSADGVNYPIFGFAPAIYAKEYIDRMFAGAGFTYNCPFFSSPYFKSLIIPCTEKKDFTATAEQVRFLDIVSKMFKFRNNRMFDWMERASPVTNPAGEPGRIDKYDWVKDEHPVDIVFTNDIETSFQINFKYIFHHHSDRVGSINVRCNGELIVPTIYTTNDQVITEVVEIPRRKYFVGDELSISIAAPPNGEVTYFPETNWIAPSPNDTSQYPVDDNTPIHMNEFVSKAISQRDFFKSILLMHNLYVFTDETNDKNLFIVPQAWFYDNYAGNAVDWTDKQATEREREVIPMGELAAREYMYTYKKDEDYYNNDRYFKIYEQVYGQKSATVDNDFEKDTKKVELIFSPTVSVTGSMEGLNNRRTIPHIYKVDKDGIKERDTFNIRILQYGGMKPSLQAGSDAFAYWSILDSSNNNLSGNLTHYPYAGMLDDPDAPTRDLCFGPPQAIWMALTTYPDVGLYKYWWEGFINEITNKDSKLVSQWFYLTPSDINHLDFKRLVKVGDTYFKLNKIENYKALGNTLSRAELFKTAVKVEIERPGFWLWSDDGYFLHSDESPARIPYA